MVLLTFKLTSVGQTIPVKELELNESVKIGRATSNNPCLPNNLSFNNQVLSRNHACIFEKDGKIFIKDTNSSNGTMVNGCSISSLRAQQPHIELKSGDTIQFGSDVCLDNGSYHYAVCGTILYDFCESKETSTAYECDSVDTIDGSSNCLKETLPNVEQPANNEGTVVPSQKRNGYGRIKRILKHYESFEEIYSKKLGELDQFVCEVKKNMETHYKLFHDQSLLISRIRSLEAQLAIYTCEYQGDHSINDVVSYEKKISDIECRWKDDLLRLHFNSKFEVRKENFNTPVEKVIKVSPLTESKESDKNTCNCLHNGKTYTETEAYKLVLDLHSRIKSLNNQGHENGIGTNSDVKIEQLTLSIHLQTIIDEIDQQTLSFTLRKNEENVTDDQEDSGLNEVPKEKPQIEFSNIKVIGLVIFSIGLVSSIFIYYGSM